MHTAALIIKVVVKFSDKNFPKLFFDTPISFNILNLSLSSFASLNILILASARTKTKNRNVPIAYTSFSHSTFFVL